MRERWAERPAADKIRVAVFRVRQPMVIEMIDPGVRTARSLVGGECEWLTLQAFSSGQRLVLVCNEMGRLLKLPANKLVIFQTVMVRPGEGGIYQERIIVGDFFVHRLDEHGRSTSILDADLEQLKKLVGF